MLLREVNTYIIFIQPAKDVKFIGFIKKKNANLVILWDEDPSSTPSGQAGPQCPASRRRSAC